MENEYQEALNDVINNAKDWSVKNDSFWLLQELVDRATPMKPIKATAYDDFNNFFYEINVCPKCNCEVLVGQCCSDNDCRQAIDWENE